MALWTDPRIKTLFSEKVLENLDAAHVWSEGFNTNWEGEIKGKGSTVRIFSFPRPTPSAYNVPSTDLSAQIITYSRLSPTHQELVIDQDHGWAIAEDRVQDMMARPDLFAELAQNAAWSLVDLSDRHLATVLLAGGVAAGLTGSGTGSAPIVGHGAGDDVTAYIVMERLRELLKNNSVPGAELHLFVPTWFMTMLRADLRFTGFGTVESRKTARGEDIIMLAGITIHETINALDGAGTAFSTVPDVNGQNTIICNWKGAATWARLVDPKSMTDTIPAENNVLSHDNLMRSRYIWGAKATISEGILSQVVERGEYEPS